MSFKAATFLYNSPEYKEALALRYKILRKPLNLQFTEAELARDKEDIHLGIFENDKIVACLILSKYNEQKIKLRQVAVDGPYQNKGLGKELTLAAEKYARDNGFAKIFCHARKTAAPFYLKLGYKIAGDEFLEVNIPHYRMEKTL